MDMKTQKLVAASVVGLVATAGFLAAQSQPQAHEAKKIPCYGVNKCKGAGACAGAAGCAGRNECAGHGFVNLEKDDCLRINGGRLTAQEPKKDKQG